MASDRHLTQACIPTSLLLFPPHAFPPPNFGLQPGYSMGCAPAQFPMLYMGMPQPGGAPLPSATPAKRRHVKKKT
eukprot:228197-Rhodomonas_salina.1